MQGRKRKKGGGREKKKVEYKEADKHCWLELGGEPVRERQRDWEEKGERREQRVPGESLTLGTHSRDRDPGEGDGDVLVQQIDTISKPGAWLL